MVILRAMWRLPWQTFALLLWALLLWLVGPWAPAAAESLQNPADARTGVFGIWASKGSIFSIYEADGQLHARVMAMRKPRLDQKNPVPELRARPVIGLQVLSGYEFRRGAWRGRIYDPASGKTFKSHIKPDADGNLRVRGYVGLSLFGRTQVFHPVSACTERIVSMLAGSELEHLC